MYDLVLVFHSNYVSLVFFSEIASDMLMKAAIFHTRLIFGASAGGDY